MAVDTITQRASDFTPTEREWWLPVVGYEGHYEISDLGRVRRNCGVRRLRILRQFRRRDGYRSVALSRSGKVKNFLVHRLAIRAFLGEYPPGHETNHKSGDRGDNRLENLEAVTRGENLKHSYKYLGRKSPCRRGEESHLTKLSVTQVQEIRRRGLTESPTTLGREFGMSVGAIRHIIFRRSWRHVP